MTERPRRVFEYGAFQQPTSPLFRDYLEGAPRVAPFFDGGGWDMDALARSAEAARRFPRSHAEAAEALEGQQRARGSGAAAERAVDLRRPETVAVVTGQQPGLFGGPLYVLYKALGALKAARLLQARGRPAVAVFWVAADDHDFAEVRSASVIDEAGQIRTLRYSPHREPVGQPAWKIPLDETIAALVAELGQALPATPFRDEIVARVAECYRPGESLSGAFARLLSALLPDLVVLDPSDPALKTLSVPPLRREIREGSPTSRLAMEAGKKLLAAGFHQQVPVRPGFLNLFVYLDGERRALGASNGQVEVRGAGRKMTVEEAVRLLETEPERWGPGVLLRPLVQDVLLPTAGYVGGPAETAYPAQTRPAYAHTALQL